MLTFDLPASAMFSDGTTLTSGQGLDPTLFGFRPRNRAKSVVFHVVGTSYNSRVWCTISTTARRESAVRPGARLLCRGLAHRHRRGSWWLRIRDPRSECDRHRALRSTSRTQGFVSSDPPTVSYVVPPQSRRRRGAVFLHISILGHAT